MNEEISEKMVEVRKKRNKLIAAFKEEGLVEDGSLRKSGFLIKW